MLFFATILVLLLAAWNGAAINWKHNEPFIGKNKLWWFGTSYKDGEAWSKFWHFLGVLIKVLIAWIYIYYEGWDYIGLSWLAVICYPVWDILIALFMRQKWYYTGTTASTDKLPDIIEYTIKGMVVMNLIAASFGFEPWGILTGGVN